MSYPGPQSRSFSIPHKPPGLVHPPTHPSIHPFKFDNPWSISNALDLVHLARPAFGNSDPIVQTGEFSPLMSEVSSLSHIQMIDTTPQSMAPDPERTKLPHLVASPGPGNLSCPPDSPVPVLIPRGSRLTAPADPSNRKHKHRGVFGSYQGCSSALTAWAMTRPD